jgi:uncharacterized phage protein (TIGR02220 family)
MKDELSLIYRELTTLRNRIGQLIQDEEPKQKKDWSGIDQLILTFSNITKKNYRPTMTNRKIFAARLSDGFTHDDVSLVIAHRNREWKGTQWEKYLRPQTLLSASKFEGYLNEARLAKPDRNSELEGFV